MLFFAVMRQSDQRIVATYSGHGDLDKEALRTIVVGNTTLTTNKRYSTKGSMQVVNYVLDAAGRVYIVVTNPAYPVHVAFQVIDEFQEQFTKDYGNGVATAKEEGLTKASKKLFVQLYEK